ncbi:sensory box histidine kinase/response regulator [Legionella hackeliae]|nr:sensory box histidine kinase/response regulator [Legionella hackeliae]
MQKRFSSNQLAFKKLHEIIESVLNEASQATNTDQELDNLRAQLRVSHPDVLIAEDNPVNRMLLTSLLQENSTIETVDDGEEAVKICQSKRYNAILLDLQMPKLNGLDAARLIRHESMLNKQTPIIVISADSSNLSKEKLKKSRGRFLFTKAN